MQGDIVERGPLVEVSPHVVKRWPVQGDIAERGPLVEVKGPRVVERWPVQEDIAERGREIWRVAKYG